MPGLALSEWSEVGAAEKLVSLAPRGTVKGRELARWLATT